MKNIRIIAALCAAAVLTSCAAGSGQGGTPPAAQEQSVSETSAAPTEDNTPSDGSPEENSSADNSSADNASADNAPADGADTGVTVNADIPPVVFGMESGFYADNIELELSCAAEGAVIRYTTDGSEPDENDEIYKGAIKLRNRSHSDNYLSAVRGINPSGDYVPSKSVDKANVIRAAAFMPDGSRSVVSSGTYFVGVDREGKYGGVPVLSIMTDTKNLFDYEKGIYVLGKAYDEWLAEDSKNASLEGWQKKGNYSGKGKEWERPAAVEYFDAEGRQGFVQDMGIRVMGAASRGESQKSFRITARAEYGPKSVKYELIPDNYRSDGEGKVEKYKSFVIRNGGNDCNFARMRDPFLQELVYDRRFDTEQYIPCVVFIDGEYWGMYTLGEDYNDNYIENNYGIKSKDVAVVKRGALEDGEEGDMELYYDMYDFITDSDMSDPANYEKACRMIDMGSFADYCAFNLYIYNEDSIFKDNNWEMWRVRNADGATPWSDGKWRMMVYDVDYSTGIYVGGGNSKHDSISEALNFDPVEAAKHDPYADPDNVNERHPVWMFQSLCENPDFRRELVNAMCDIRNINFRCPDTIDRLISTAEPFMRLMPDNYRRFGPEWIAKWNDPDTYIESQINGLATFIDGRYEAMPAIIQKAFGLESQAQLSLSVSDGEKGAVRINASGADINSDLKGVYFTDFDITLTALPKNGSSFVRWESSGCTLSDPASPTVTVSFEGDFSVKAVFE